MPISPVLERGTRRDTLPLPLPPLLLLPPPLPYLPSMTRGRRSRYRSSPASSSRSSSTSSSISRLRRRISTHNNSSSSSGVVELLEVEVLVVELLAVAASPHSCLQGQGAWARCCHQVPAGRARLAGHRAVGRAMRTEAEALLTAEAVVE